MSTRRSEDAELRRELGVLAKLRRISYNRCPSAFDRCLRCGHGDRGRIDATGLCPKCGGTHFSDAWRNHPAGAPVLFYEVPNEGA